MAGARSGKDKVQGSTVRNGMCVSEMLCESRRAAQIGKYARRCTTWVEKSIQEGGEDQEKCMVAAVVYD